jgi:putative transposase
MRRTQLIKGEYYHIYNRGVDKRNVFLDDSDYFRFLEGVKEFNRIDPIGSLYQNSFRDKSGSESSSSNSVPKRVVEIIAYCLNPNHYHFILKQLTDEGISKFMLKISSGYTSYFNCKYKRTGVLFQGTFKAAHIKSNDLLLRLSTYVNMNSEIHGICPAKKYRWCSYPEYLKYRKKTGLCKKNIVLSQFRENEGYEKFSKENAHDFRERKEDEKLMLEF